MGKIVCEKCGTEYKFEIAKNFESCPVCGASFSDENLAIEKDNLSNELEKANQSKMHVNEVHYQDNQMEGFIRIQCKQCLDMLYIDIDDAEIIKDSYVKLKSECKVECEKCGYKHASSYLTYCETVSKAPPLPRCPVCNSAMLKKITTGSKFLAAATVGMFALPYNSKTFECKDCGYRF